MSKVAAKSKPSSKNSPDAGAAEDGDGVEPSPPDVVEPDPDLSPEEAEQARKDYLLTRFWISARGFWGKQGDRLPWIFSIGLVVLIVTNVGFAEDLRVATDSPVDFVAGVTSAFLSASTFIVVLWTIGGALTVTVAGSSLTIPGFLVIAAGLYAAIASGSIVVIGRRFVQISEDKNQAEAEYRYTLTRVRENGESIALLGGDQEERDGIGPRFGSGWRQWARLAGQA